MKRALYILSVCLLAAYGQATAQNSFRALVKSDGDDTLYLSGAAAHVAGTDIATVADSAGMVFLQNIPDGEHVIEFSYTGYFHKKYKVSFPRPVGDMPLLVTLQTQALQVEDVIVSTTRNYQKAEYLPIQVEVIGDDEVEEQSHDKPSDVSHVVREQTGVQVQRTSATAGTLGVRLQGLSTNYVQILKDGVPLFGGFSNVIGLTQIPPLDLKQVEIIKGPSSTLYGGDAIAGVINLVSKVPNQQPVYDLLFNGESAYAFDGGLYASQKIKWFAFSVMGAYRYQKEKDWSGRGFTETPRLNRYTLSPQLFFDLGKHALLNIGGNYTHEYRLGGTMAYLQSKADSTNNYYEKNTSEHGGANLKFEYDFNDKGKLTAKSAFNYFKRGLLMPYNIFEGTQLASASEINYRFVHKKHDVVLGFDFRTDRFTESPDSSATPHNYSFYTIGFFAQYMYHFNEKTTVEGGLRIDYHNVYKVYPLPHFALLHHWNPIFSTRINIGMGYKVPTIFQAESEEARFIHILPIQSNVKPELSLGGTINLKAQLPNFNGVHVTINQLYFLTNIFSPIIADTSTIPDCTSPECIQLRYHNRSGHIQTLGVETGIHIGYRGFGTAFTYTLTDNHRKLDDIASISPLTSKHIVSMMAGYEIKNFYIGIDCYYYSAVKLTNGLLGHGIWEVGINTQYAYRFLLLFANLENIANIRQTSYSPVVFPNPTYAHPSFTELYGPLEGRLFNAGIKLRLGQLGKNKSKPGTERLQRKDDD